MHLPLLLLPLPPRRHGVSELLGDAGEGVTQDGPACGPLDGGRAPKGRLGWDRRRGGLFGRERSTGGRFNGGGVPGDPPGRTRAPGGRFGWDRPPGGRFG
ncbi:hypothetical protein [Streptomyces sp. NPDC000405]|uniref:hypothetical protein n=1 Tax=Streptomyces sp. NPDC000405 TaxID=3161033 RepID=UPI00398CB475